MKTEITILTKEQQNEVKDIIKNTVKNGLKRNCSSIRLLKDDQEKTDDGVSLAVSAYFFTVGRTESIMGVETIRWNMSFKTKIFKTIEEAYSSLKEILANTAAYKFEKIKTEDNALYKTVYQSDYAD